MKYLKNNKVLKNCMPHNNLILIFLLSLCIFVGCSSDSIVNSSSSSNKSTARFTHNPTDTTEFQSIPTHTPPFAETKIPLKTSTMSPSDIRLTVMDLFKSNGGCPLPCWWGFVPGKTVWEEFKHVLMPISDITIRGNRPERFVADVFIETLKEKDIYPWHYYIFQDNVLESIEVFDPRYTSDIGFYDILEKYGKPGEIWFRTYSEGVGGEPPPLSIALYYPDYGIVTEYSFKGNVFDSKIKGCPTNDGIPALGLWAPDLDLTFIDAANRFHFGHDAWPYHPLEQVTNMDVNMFYNTFLGDGDSICLESDKDFWTPQR